MLKFLIRPILENSISQGLADKRSDACIGIRVWSQDAERFLSEGVWNDS